MDLPTRYNQVKQVLILGLLSGIFLGLFMKYSELLSGFRVYRLLLNLNFRPFEKELDWPESLEFLIHLLVSIIIAWVYTTLNQKYKNNLLKRLLSAVIVITPALILYFPLTILGSSEVDPVSFIGFAIWTIGHLLYACILASMAKQ